MNATQQKIDSLDRYIKNNKCTCVTCTALREAAIDVKSRLTPTPTPTPTPTVGHKLEYPISSGFFRYKLDMPKTTVSDNYYRQIMDFIAFGYSPDLMPKYHILPLSIWDKRDSGKITDPDWVNRFSTLIEWFHIGSPITLQSISSSLPGLLIVSQQHDAKNGIPMTRLFDAAVHHYVLARNGDKNQDHMSHYNWYVAQIMQQQLYPSSYSKEIFDIIRK